MDVPTIRSATEAERQAAIDVVTLGFASDPITRWSLPDPTNYLAAFPSFVDAFGGPGLAHGATYIVDGFEGAAFWLPPGIEPDAERMISICEAHVPAGRFPDLLAVFEQMTNYHPSEPHWYLPLIAVDPALQGRGFGAILMRHALQRCDADGVPAYLESSNARNISLYQRHGFEILGTILVGSSPPVVPMLRLPR